MKIFISYSHKDEPSYHELADLLKSKGHRVFSPQNDIEFGESFIDAIKDFIDQCEVFIPIVTDNLLNSSWANTEISYTTLHLKEILIIPVVVGDVHLPLILTDMQYLHVDTKSEIPAAVMKAIDQIENLQNNHADFQISKVTAPNKSNIKEQIKLLNKALIDNQLTLVCGSGISRDSSIPTWDELLVNILNDVFSNKDDSENNKITADSLLSIMPQSNLILGKYLKLILNDDFNKVVQKHLYLDYNLLHEDPINPNLETNMMKAIVALSRPKRRGKQLESIITFNFDDLIEKALSIYNIEHTSIWKEGQPYAIDSLPIYHVHGFLPNEQNFEEPNLVFSEESYHSQFIDPYNWSNLIQLNTFSTNICLFVGLSLSDPNLRRLLDISWRRNQRRKHYIIMKKSSETGKTAEISTMLFEQDANSLGLNVIWCSDYSEIPDILLKILKR